MNSAWAFSGCSNAGGRAHSRRTEPDARSFLSLRVDGASTPGVVLGDRFECGAILRAKREAFNRARLDAQTKPHR